MTAMATRPETPSSGGVRVVVAGETLALYPERAALWERTHTLLLADPHWGKAASFRSAGVPVPRGTTLHGLRRLDALVVRTRPARIVFLGDFLHAREGRAPETLHAFEEWRRANTAIEMVLVRGNHDRSAGDPPLSFDIRCVDAPLVDSPFVFMHHPAPAPSEYAVAGHLHPAAELTGVGRQRERLPCFWLRADCMVMPAFGDFTGAATVSPAANDRVFVIAGDRVMNVSPSAAAPSLGTRTTDTFL